MQSSMHRPIILFKLSICYTLQTYLISWKCEGETYICLILSAVLRLSYLSQMSFMVACTDVFAICSVIPNIVVCIHSLVVKTSGPGSQGPGSNPKTCHLIHVLGQDYWLHIAPGTWYLSSSSTQEMGSLEKVIEVVKTSFINRFKP